MGRRRHIDAEVVLVLGDAELATWPLAGCGRPDLSVVDNLARLQLAARRVGCSIRLRNAGQELTELIDLVGLSEVVAGVCPLREVGGEAEGAEQGGVKEIVMPHDPVA